MRVSYRGCWQHLNPLVSQSRAALLAGAQKFSQQSFAALSAHARVELREWTLCLDLGSLILIEVDRFLPTSGGYPRDWDLWWWCRLPPGGEVRHSVHFPPGRPGRPGPPVLLREVLVVVVVIVIVLIKSLSFPLASGHQAGACRSPGPAGTEPGPGAASPGCRGGGGSLGLQLCRLHLLLPAEPDLGPQPGPSATAGVDLVRPHSEPLAASKGGPGGFRLLGHQAGPADHALAGDWLDGQRGRHREGRRPQRVAVRVREGLGSLWGLGRENARVSLGRLLLEGRAGTWLEPQVGLHVRGLAGSEPLEVGHGRDGGDVVLAASHLGPRAGRDKPCRARVEPVGSWRLRLWLPRDKRELLL